MRHLTAFAVVALLSCGIETGTHSTTQTSTAPLCGSEPHPNGDGTVSAVGCSFEQQYENISNHGEQHSTIEQLRAGGSLEGVSVTNSCGEWLLGTDSSGVTVFVSTSTGEVRSHGQVHAGFETSTLPTNLPLPVAAQ